MTTPSTAPARGEAGLADPHRLERAHVTGVRLDRSGVFIVRCSDGIDLTWAEWCAWGCADLRRSTLPQGRADGGAA